MRSIAHHKHLFYAELSKLVTAGFGIREAGRILQETHPPGRQQALLKLMQAGLEQGRGIVESFAADPALAELGQQLRIEQTPEGLRIQLLDAERQPMFALGGAAPNDRARQLIARVAQVAQRLPNPIAITGHTDATPFRGSGDRSNWDLSADRANATRRLLTDAGLGDALRT